jgi:hypothetical protein
MALQRWGEIDFEALAAAMLEWARGSWLERRAAAAALCEPALLTTPERVGDVLTVLAEATAGIAQADTKERRSEAFRALRKGSATAGGGCCRSAGGGAAGVRRAGGAGGERLRPGVVGSREPAQAPAGAARPRMGDTDARAPLAKKSRTPVTQPPESGIFAEFRFDFVHSTGGVFRIPPTSSSRSSFVLLSISFSVHAEDCTSSDAPRQGKHRLCGGFAALIGRQIRSRRRWGGRARPGGMRRRSVIVAEAVWRRC